MCNIAGCHILLQKYKVQTEPKNCKRNKKLNTDDMQTQLRTNIRQQSVTTDCTESKTITSNSLHKLIQFDPAN